MQSYQYEPLSTDSRATEIRLLRVHYQQTPLEDIQVTLEHAPLGDDELSEELTIYQALSYTWGPEHPQRTITINGNAFTVRENLFQFLKVFQTKSKYCETPIWIDQISIDQSNVPERNRQVQRMGDIYRSAELVLVWLGAGSEESDRVMHDIMHKRPFVWEEGVYFDQNFGNGYFDRLWIIQEIVLAGRIEVMVGQRVADWDAFVQAARKAWSYNKEDMPVSCERIATQRSKRYPGGIDYLIFMFCRYKCADPRDKIYAFFGLMRETQEDLKLSGTIDYGKSVEALWSDFCSDMISNRGIDTRAPKPSEPGELSDLRSIGKVMGIPPASQERLLDEIFAQRSAGS